jgi:predicted RNase H-like HicB family nuclease
MKFTIILRKEEEGGYSAQCLELPGCISEGETRKEALKNIREAIKGYLEAFSEEVEKQRERRS